MALEEFLTGAALVELVAAAGDRVAEEARRLAPHGLTGVLESEQGIAVDMTVDEYGPVARVGWTPRAFYGYFQEFGTVNMPPHPHLRPAVTLAAI